MRFIVLIVAVIGIATPAIGGSHDDEEETIIFRAMGARRFPASARAV